MATATPATQQIWIVLPGQNSIYATPENGNLLDIARGTQVTWNCRKSFTITLYALHGGTGLPTGPLRSSDCGDGTGNHRFTVTFPDTTYASYIVQASDPESGKLLVLDPWIGVDHH